MQTNVIYLKSSESMIEVPDNSVDLIVTSPPYNIDIQYGNKTEKGKITASKAVKYSDKMTESEYRNMLRSVFSECKRVLKNDGSIWINIKNRYNNGGILTPFWIQEYFTEFTLKNLIIWNFDWGGSTNKRFAPRYEFVFWFTKDKDNYKFNLSDISIPAVNYRPDIYKSQLKNPSDVWKIPMVSGNFLERTGHPAQYPEKLVERIILAGTNKNDVVWDPFMGSGSTGEACVNTNRNFIGIEIDENYFNLAKERIASLTHLLF